MASKTWTPGPPPQDRPGWYVVRDEYHELKAVLRVTTEGMICPLYHSGPAAEHAMIPYGPFWDRAEHAPLRLPRGCRFRDEEFDDV